MGSQSPSNQVLRFGVFELNLETQQLRKTGVLVRLQPQPFKILTVLAAQSGKVVSREQLRREVWGNETFVDFEQGLNYCIRQIRAVLSDEAQTPRFVETIPRRGYRFIAPVEGLPVSKPPAVETENAGGSQWARLRRLPSLSIAAVLIPLLIGAVVWIRLPHRPVLTEKDSILISDFENRTGDAIFDGTLRKALSSGLSQSPYLNIVSDSRIKQSLKLMGKPPDTRVTPEIAVQICKREGIRATLNGSIASFGNQYVVTLEAVNPGTGDILAQDQAQATSKEQVLHVLGRSCEMLREKLGESLTSIKRSDKPLEQVTTPSLEALQLYTLGLEKSEHEGQLAAIPFLQRAVEIDPNFALAYARLGTFHANLEQWQASEQYENKALALIDRVSDRERLYITGHHYNRIGDKEKEIQTYEEYARLYPQDAVPHGNLAFNYSLLGQYEKAIDHALMGLRANPEAIGVYTQLAESYEAVGKIAEAKSILAKGLEHSPENWDLHLQLSNVSLVQGDTAAQKVEDMALKASFQGTLNLLYRDASLAASRGQLHRAQELYSQAGELSLKFHLVDNASYAAALQAMHESYLQDYSAAKRTALAALKLSRMPDTLEPVAVALAEAHENQQAHALVSQLAKQRPDDTFAQFVYVPMIAALIDLNSGDADKALQDLRPSLQYDRGNLDPMLVRANAYLMAKRTSEAADEYRRILALKARFPYDPVCSLAQFGLARTYALAGDASRSHEAYEVLLVLWKDADSDLPVLKQAKSEYAALQPDH